MDDNITLNEEKGLIEVKGVVEEILPDFIFRVRLENGVVMMAKGSGRLRKKRIRISVLDKVLIEISKYDLNFGRVARRLDDKKEDYRSQGAKNQKRQKK
jgi:translation initiation factor IF-1